MSRFLAFEGVVGVDGAVDGVDVGVVVDGVFVNCVDGSLDLVDKGVETGEGLANAIFKDDSCISDSLVDLRSDQVEGDHFRL